MTTRAALFVDFDNVYLGLRESDPAAAEAFATDPATWVSGIADADGERSDQRMLIRNCYLNPSRFSKYRAYWTRAGFRVVDCPSLTQQGKSSTDINLVLDAVDVLAGAVRIDEFVIASADADFTSLVQRIRAADRRTTVVVAGAVAVAYRAMADRVIESDDLVELVLPASRRDAPPAAATPTSAAGRAAAVAPGHGPARTAVLAALAEAPGAVPLATLALRARSADQRLTHSWGEHATFRRWLEALDAPIGIGGAPGSAWDRTRFPDGVPTQPGQDAIVADGLTSRIARVTGVPKLTTEQFALVLRTLAADLAAHPFAIAETAKRVRDACSASEVPVGRGAIQFMVHGLIAQGAPLDDTADATALAVAWVANVEGLCAGARMELEVSELEELRAWAGGGLLQSR